MTLHCELCDCDVVDSHHHLIPRTVHTNKWFQKRYTREVLSKTIGVCKSCHRTIHNVVPKEKDLGRDYYTIDKLKAHPTIQGHIEWRKKGGRPTYKRLR